MRRFFNFLHNVLVAALILLVVLAIVWYFYPTAPQFELAYYWRIDNYLHSMTPEVQNSITSISIVERLAPKNPKITVAGICDSDGNICFMALAIVIQPSTIWHESAHAYHFWLDRKRNNFSQRWININGGVLTDYGRTNFREDVAEWVQEIYKDLDGDRTGLDHAWTNENAGPYRRKLQLLREYKFISEDDYQKIIEMHPALTLGAVFI